MATIKQAVAAKRANGDPEKGTISKVRTSLDTTADIRDALSYLVGNGSPNFVNDETARGHLASMSGTLGTQQARKLALSAYLFNQRPGVAAMRPEERIKMFYDMGSADPEVKAQLEKIRTFGSGPVAGFQSSVDVGNMGLAGKDVTAYNKIAK